MTLFDTPSSAIDVQGDTVIFVPNSIDTLKVNNIPKSVPGLNVKIAINKPISDLLDSTGARSRLILAGVSKLGLDFVSKNTTTNLFLLPERLDYSDSATDIGDLREEDRRNHLNAAMRDLLENGPKNILDGSSKGLTGLGWESPLEEFENALESFTVKKINTPLTVLTERFLTPDEIALLERVGTVRAYFAIWHMNFSGKSDMRVSPLLPKDITR